MLLVHGQGQGSLETADVVMALSLAEEDPLFDAKIQLCDT
jgi:hypothetical protein